MGKILDDFYEVFTGGKEFEQFDSRLTHFSLSITGLSALCYLTQLLYLTNASAFLT